MDESTLAPYAIKASMSRGRKYPEPDDPLRNPFQRDRDRIVHCKAFRRLSGKTQVFIPSYGDHYRSRLTHSLEVSMTARDIARALHLHEDLCECIALAHDLGHTPFGHAGEEAMNDLLAKFGDHFEHNEQSLRVVEVLEQKSPDFPGLNLTFEVLEGLQKHQNIVHSLESQVVDIADFIAYLHHDLDDGLRSGILFREQLIQRSQLFREIGEDLEDGSEELQRRICITRLMNLLVDDLIVMSKQRISEQGLQAPLNSQPSVPIVSFSEKIQKKADELYECLGQELYLHEKVVEHSVKGKNAIRFLFEWFSQHEDLLPRPVRERFEREPRHIVIKDYIAGMTDRFALQLVRKYNTLILNTK